MQLRWRYGGRRQRRDHPEHQVSFYSLLIWARHVIKTRMVKPRKEFGLENHQMIEKDAADQTVDLKQTTSKGAFPTIKKKKVL